MRIVEREAMRPKGRGMVQRVRVLRWDGSRTKTPGNRQLRRKWHHARRQQIQAWLGRCGRDG